LLAACISITTDPRALVYEPAGIRVQTLQCAAAVQAAHAFERDPTARPDNAVAPDAIRLVSWNIHKEEDPGWEDDLARFARTHDVVLLQEVSLRDPVQAILRNAGLQWILASSFIVDSADVGVLTATGVVPVANCTQRTVEPIVRIPKSAVITWLPLAGAQHTLAVANVHAINFTLTLDAYQDQLGALVTVLQDHRGPIVLAGDFNTWSDGRLAVLREAATRLQLVETAYRDDRRTRFLGRHVDHVFVRGLDVVAAAATPVESSDHNPLQVVLRLQ
jgi:endonuclease/exonuclease/phosphatase (EEP) superfamily protein YafD